MVCNALLILPSISTGALQHVVAAPQLPDNLLLMHCAGPLLYCWNLTGAALQLSLCCALRELSVFVCGVLQSEGNSNGSMNALATMN
jgi:hypothetical protein